MLIGERVLNLAERRQHHTAVAGNRLRLLRRCDLDFAISAHLTSSQ